MCVCVRMFVCVFVCISSANLYIQIHTHTHNVISISNFPALLRITFGYPTMCKTFNAVFVSFQFLPLFHLLCSLICSQRKKSMNLLYSCWLAGWSLQVQLANENRRERKKTTNSEWTNVFDVIFFKSIQILFHVRMLYARSSFLCLDCKNYSSWWNFYTHTNMVTNTQPTNGVRTHTERISQFYEERINVSGMVFFYSFLAFWKSKCVVFFFIFFKNTLIRLPVCCLAKCLDMRRTWWKHIRDWNFMWRLKCSCSNGVHIHVRFFVCIVVALVKISFSNVNAGIGTPAAKKPKIFATIKATRLSNRQCPNMKHGLVFFIIDLICCRLILLDFLIWYYRSLKLFSRLCEEKVVARLQNNHISLSRLFICKFPKKWAQPSSKIVNASHKLLVRSLY